jgi:2-polyprenyl-3-methyl-5-hydroxy-6-metoxy-1,4-benzoquinol methylase
MKLPLKPESSYLNIDLNKLRPKDSYGKLISQRNHNIDRLIKEKGKIPDEYLSLRTCPNCGSENFTKELHKDSLDIVKCLDCETVYVNPIFNEKHYDETYQSVNYQKVVEELGHSSHSYRVERFGKERVQKMSEFIPAKDKISFLDVGCSTGFVVEAALSLNWDAMGIDLNPSAIDFGVSLGLPLEKKKIQEITNQKFDVIGMFDVLEHIPYPKEILDHAYSLLNPGGIIYIYVPNYNSASRLLMGSDAHFIWPSHHLTLYTPTTLKLQLENSNFQFEWFETEGLDIFDYIWFIKNKSQAECEELEKISDHLQFFINASGYGKNLRMICRKV